MAARIQHVPTAQLVGLPASCTRSSNVHPEPKKTHRIWVQHWGLVKSLQAKLAYWRVKPPSRTDLEDQFFPGMMESAASSIAGCDSRGPIDTAELWNYASYEAILYGIDFLSKECDTWFGKDRSQSPIHGKTIEAIRNARQTLPKHEAFLREALDMPEYPRHYLTY